MGEFFWDLGSFLVALGLLITIHEFGHFWVARRCGVKVERFSVGFGKPFYSRYDRHGTEFVLAMIPLGGYVKMLDERVAPVPAESQNQAFNTKRVEQRAAIIAAGPIANFIFAILAYWLVFIIGVPTLKPVVGDVQPNSIAQQAEIVPGMELKSIDGIEVTDWASVRMSLLGLIGKSGAEIGFGPLNTDTVIFKRVDLQNWHFEPDKQDPVAALGIQPQRPKVEPVISEIKRGSAAEKAGLQIGDRVVKVNDNPLQEWEDFVQVVKSHPEQPVVLYVERPGGGLSLTLVPQTRQLSEGHVEGFAGVNPTLPDVFNHSYGPLEAIPKAVEKTWQLTALTFKMIGKLITGDVKLKTLSGPLSIAQGAGMSAEYGLVSFLTFLALISINLGVLNLLPLPVLDGGHLLFLLVEKIKGTPVSEQVQEYSYRIGAMMLVLLMGLALFNDFSRL